MNDLDQIALEAAALDAETMAPPAGLADAAGMAPMVDPTAEWIDAANMGCGLVIAVYPELKDDWTKDRLDALGVALSKCAERYGWTVAELLGHPLVGLAFATWPLGAALVRVTKAREAEKARTAKPATPAASTQAMPEPVTGRPGIMAAQPAA